MRAAAARTAESYLGHRIRPDEMPECGIGEDESESHSPRPVDFTPHGESDQRGHDQQASDNCNLFQFFLPPLDKLRCSGNSLACFHS